MARYPLTEYPAHRLYTDEIRVSVAQAAKKINDFLESMILGFSFHTPIEQAMIRRAYAEFSSHSFRFPHNSCCFGPYHMSQMNPMAT